MAARLRPARAQARPGLAARARTHAGLRGRPPADRRGRGEARPDRDAAERAAVRAGERAGDRRQARRAGRPAVSLAWRALEQSGGSRAGRAHPQARPGRYGGGPPCGAAPAPRRRAGAHQPDPAHAVFLLRLSPQHLDPRAGWQHRARRHRLPLHGPVDGPRQYGLHPDGRRGRELGRRGAVLDARPRVPEPGRRHLFPLRQPWDPGCGRGRRQHHLQDPLQRRGRDDRRPERRWPAVGAADHPRGDGRRRQARGRGDRRAGKVSLERGVRPRSDHSSSRRARRGAARAARDRGHHGAGLRSDLRGREAAPAQARDDGRSAPARGDQRAGVRGLRRLRPRLELRVDRAGRDRVRAQAPDRSVELQQGLLLPERLLPELRHGRRRALAQAKARGRAR